MTLNQAFRYELEPTVRQQRLPARAAGTARYAFHWGLALCKRLLDAGKPVPHAPEPHRQWNAEKPPRSWVYGVSGFCGQEALRDLDRACAHFRCRQGGPPRGVPALPPQARATGTGSIQVHPRSVALPRIGCVRTKGTTEKLRGRVLSATVRREADRRYVSLAVETERDAPQPVNGPVVGIDLGLKSFAVLSDGTRLESPKPLAKAQRRLRHRQRLHSRKQRGSRNRSRSAVGLARLHRRIRCPRADFLHKATTDLAKTKSVMVIEDLSVRGIIRNRHLSRSIADARWGGFRRMLEHETVWYGSRLVIAPRCHPSTKTCSACGHVQDGMPLGERVFRCDACGPVLDRHLNAARNLASLVAGSSP